MTLLSMSLRLRILAALGLAAVVLAACGGNLPNSAVSRHLAGRYAGALTDSTAVATVIRDRGIRSPDPASAVPLLEQLRAELAAFQSGTDWQPQRVLDSLIESTLAAATTPFGKTVEGADEPATDEASPPADRPRGG